MDAVSVFALLFAFVAAVASVVAALAAVQAVRLTRLTRDEDNARRLAEALIAVMTAAENYPKTLGAAAGRDEAFNSAIDQLKRATALSILGLSADVSEPVLALLEKDAWK